MHEAGIALNIVQIVEQSAAANSMARVEKVVLEIGQFSGVEVSALEFALKVYCKNTALEQVEFEFQTPPLLLYCLACRNQYIGDPEDLRCPSCESERYRVLQGRELKVKSISGEQG